MTEFNWRRKPFERSPVCSVCHRADHRRNRAKKRDSAVRKVVERMANDRKELRDASFLAGIVRSTLRRIGGATKFCDMLSELILNEPKLRVRLKALRFLATMAVASDVPVRKSKEKRDRELPSLLAGLDDRQIAIVERLARQGDV